MPVARLCADDQPRALAAYAAYAAVSTRVPTLLKELNLTHGDIRFFTTPRRIVVSIDSLSPNQPDREDLVKGPPADKAFDKDGKPTQAALGFAKKNNLDPATLEAREIDGGKYVAAADRPWNTRTSETVLVVAAELRSGSAIAAVDVGVRTGTPDTGSRTHSVT